MRADEGLCRVHPAAVTRNHGRTPSTRGFYDLQNVADGRGSCAPTDGADGWTGGCSSRTDVPRPGVRVGESAERSTEFATSGLPREAGESSGSRCELEHGLHCANRPLGLSDRGVFALVLSFALDGQEGLQMPPRFPTPLLAARGSARLELMLMARGRIDLPSLAPSGPGGSGRCGWERSPRLATASSSRPGQSPFGGAVAGPGRPVAAGGAGTGPSGCRCRRWVHGGRRVSLERLTEDPR